MWMRMRPASFGRFCRRKEKEEEEEGEGVIYSLVLKSKKVRERGILKGVKMEAGVDVGVAMRKKREREKERGVELWGRISTIYWLVRVCVCVCARALSVCVRAYVCACACL